MEKSLSHIQRHYKGQDIISIDQFTANDLEILFNHTDSMKDLADKCKPSNLLAGIVVSLLFFEPSSRTFNSFSAAIQRLGGHVITMQDVSVSSVVKGESFEDTVRVFEAYSNAMVIRSKDAGYAQKAADTASLIPVINAGDGSGEHPTQALMDLYTLKKHFGRLHNLKGLIAGDMLYSRTAHSLIRGLSLYNNNTVILLSPKSLMLSRDLLKDFSQRNITLVEINNEKDIPKDCDFWYWTRVQKERFSSTEAYEKIKSAFTVTTKFLNTYGNDKMVLMDPLPRVHTIQPELDNDKRAIYLREQIRNGVYTRMALMALVLGKI